MCTRSNPKSQPAPVVRCPTVALLWSTQEVSRGLELPRYRGLDWRLQIQLGGRDAAQKPPQANFLMRLRTSYGSQGPAEHLMQADLTNMRRLASELEGALREESATHSRRIARRL